MRPDDKQQGHEHRVQRGRMTGLHRAGSDGEESGGEEGSGTASLRQARVGCSDSAGPRGEAESGLLTPSQGPPWGFLVAVTENPVRKGLRPKGVYWLKNPRVDLFQERLDPNSLTVWPSPALSRCVCLFHGLGGG